MNTNILSKSLFQGIIGLIAWCLIPYSYAAGLLTPSDSNLPALTISDHRVNVTIEQGYAITEVEQVFHNPHKFDLEAIYSFPVPDHGSVTEFTIWIDGNPVNGEVIEKKQARKIYEEEKRAGREAGLTEKDSYKTFDISVFPVRANHDTRIRLVYLQPTHVDTGIGRYVYPLEEGGTDEQKLAFWTSNEKVMGKFSFDLKVRSEYPVDALRLPQHGQAIITQLGKGEWTASINVDSANQIPGKPITNHLIKTSTQIKTNSEQSQDPVSAPVYSLDKDIVVYWRHANGLPGSVDLVAYKPENSNKGTFMMVVTPGDDLKPITEGSDWVFVLDISGSMSGKYATLADGVQRAMKKMRANDRFRIVLFNNTSSELTSGYVNATPENVNYYSQKVAGVTPGNGTNLYAGLKEGLNSIDADRTSAIVLVTDGVANVGETQQRNFLKLIRKKDIRLFTFIMGNGSDRPMLEALARHSGGFSISVSNSDDIVGQILLATSKVTHETMHGAKIKISGIKTADMTPADIHSVYRGQQLIVFGHYWGSGEASVELNGRLSGKDKQYVTRFNFPAVTTENPEIERLWAYAKIESLTEQLEDFGEDADIKQAIIDIATEYSLVTDYTSMLVVRDEIFTKYNIERKNKQRLATEQAAQQLRANNAIPIRRADTSQPMFRSNRANLSSGGGAFDPMMFLLLPMILIWKLRRKHKKSV